jgi:hypothetical protein
MTNSELADAHAKGDRQSNACDFLICPDCGNTMRRIAAVPRSSTHQPFYCDTSRSYRSPIFEITTTELAARPVANRSAMPIDCHNTDSRAGQRLNLTCCSRSVPNPRDLPRQNSACLAIYVLKNEAIGAGTNVPPSRLTHRDVAINSQRSINSRGYCQRLTWLGSKERSTRLLTTRRTF